MCITVTKWFIFFQLEWETILFRKLISVIVTVPFKGRINQPLSKKELMKGVEQQRTIILNIYFNIYIYIIINYRFLN